MWKPWAGSRSGLLLDVIDGQRPESVVLPSELIVRASSGTPDPTPGPAVSAALPQTARILELRPGAPSDTTEGAGPMSTVFVVGSLNIDQNVRVSSLPRAGETVRGSDATFSPGGKGGNQAVAAARAGATGEIHRSSRRRRPRTADSRGPVRRPHRPLGHVADQSATPPRERRSSPSTTAGRTRSSSVRAQTPASPPTTSKRGSTPSRPATSWSCSWRLRRRWSGRPPPSRRAAVPSSSSTPPPPPGRSTACSTTSTFWW